MSDQRDDRSPVVERPVNLLGVAQGKATRSVSGSVLPTVDLDPVSTQLLEENEMMLYEIKRLQVELKTSQEEISKLNTTIASQQAEMSALRDKINYANTHVCDASVRVANYKMECERVTGENARLTGEYAKVCAELEQHTEKIRHDTTGVRPDTARGLAAAQIQQFHREVIGLFPSVQHVVHSLRRSIPASSADHERVLDSVRKERHELQRLADTVRRMGGGWERSSGGGNGNGSDYDANEDDGETSGRGTEREREREVLARVQRGEGVEAPGDLAVLIRWMIVESLDAGITATRGNLNTFEAVINAGPDTPTASSNKDFNKNGAVGNNNKKNNSTYNSVPTEERGGVGRWAKGAARHIMGVPKK